MTAIRMQSRIRPPQSPPTGNNHSPTSNKFYLPQPTPHNSSPSQKVAKPNNIGQNHQPARCPYSRGHRLPDTGSNEKSKNTGERAALPIRHRVYFHQAFLLASPGWAVAQLRAARPRHWQTIKKPRSEILADSWPYHQSSIAPRLRPCSRAQAFASSYPASAWRITPLAGSFHNTRLIRSPAASLPSQQITRPACCE